MIKSFMIAVMLVLSSSVVSAHEMTPTYPKLTISHLPNVVKTTMEMFNKRADVEYYEIGVFDKDFNPVPFVTSYNIVKIKYLSKVTFDLYIHKDDVPRAVYVCSRSKVRKENISRAAISSRICSKFKSE